MNGKALPALPHRNVHEAPSASVSDRALIAEDLEFEALRKENQNLRRQLAFMQNELNLEKDRLVTCLRRKNGQQSRRINQLNEFVASIANTMRTAFAAYESEFGRQIEENIGDNSSEEIHVYSTFESDDE